MSSRKKRQGGDQPEELEMRLPPLGLRRGAGLLFWIAFWIGAFSIAIFEEATEQVRQRSVLGIAIFVLLGWGLGLWLLVFTIVKCYRRTELTVSGGVLRAVQTGPFGSRSWQWPREQIAQIRLAKTFPKNARSLEICPRAGKPVKLLDWRDVQELERVAGELRRALQLPEKQSVPETQSASPDDSDDGIVLTDD